jgi:hypothetical protein
MKFKNAILTEETVTYIWITERLIGRQKKFQICNSIWRKPQERHNNWAHTFQLTSVRLSVTPNSIDAFRHYHAAAYWKIFLFWKFNYETTTFGSITAYDWNIKCKFMFTSININQLWRRFRQELKHVTRNINVQFFYVLSIVSRFTNLLRYEVIVRFPAPTR